MENEFSKENPHHEIIGLASGKGGAGKTSLAINIANYCARFDEKVLLIDCDLNTCGATTFFRQSTFFSKSWGNALSFEAMLSHELNERYGGNDQNILRLKKNLYFIPAFVGLRLFRESEKYWNWLQDECYNSLEKLFAKWKTEFNTILLDFGAGVNNLYEVLFGFLDKICIIIEDDEISVSAAKEVFSDVIQKYSMEPFLLCFNKHNGSCAERDRSLFKEMYGTSFSKPFAEAFAKGAFYSIGVDKTSNELIVFSSSILSNGSILAEKYAEYKKNRQASLREIIIRRFFLVAAMILLVLIILLAILPTKTESMESVSFWVFLLLAIFVLIFGFLGFSSFGGSIKKIKEMIKSLYAEIL